MISGEELSRRMRKISALRQLTARFRGAALKAFEEGEISDKPMVDVRTNYQHWRAKAQQMGYNVPD